MKRFSLRYLLLTSRFDQIWFPSAFWVLMVLIAVVRGEAYVADTARAYLGAVIPLISGILSAYAVLQDPALELRFATPVRSLQTLLERLLPILLIQTFFALAFQAFAALYKADFSPYFNSWGSMQLAWLVPGLSLMLLGCFSALASANPATGAVLTGMVWLVQLVARGWFAEQAIGKYFLVFMSPFMTDHPALRANQLALAGLGILFFTASWALLRRQERYL
ncbi:MAG: hypothetical protein AAGU05_00245 [Anaerolineaceae bacterium]